MVIDGEQQSAGLLGGGTQHDRGFAAVGTDFDGDSVAQVAHRGVVEGAALVRGHEAGDAIRELEQGRGGRRKVHGPQLTVAGRIGL